MKTAVKTAFATFILLSFGFTQVCCSLVGSVNSNASASYWETQWPSLLDFNRKANWIIGSTLGKPYNGDLNIQYGFSGTLFTELSNYIFSNTVGYIAGSASVSNISEQISFEQTETLINQLNLNFGFRHFINNKIGYINGSMQIPLVTDFSNNNFLFKTNAVTSVSAIWIKTFLISTSIINQQLSLQLSASKNLTEDPLVFIDNNYSLNLSTSFNILNQFSFTPNININYYKLLAPLSPYELERQERRLGITSLGFDITPINDRINWLHFDASIPILFWVSDIGFPDGTQPIPIFSITMVKKIINK
ncbi:MAG: hypothetical protein GWP19_05710 [Planctomycetia bacterium]|nr:hypothetical protein [Planctomycetia bacterium]